MNSVLQSLLTLTPFVEELHKQSRLWYLCPPALPLILLSEVQSCLPSRNWARKKWTLVVFLTSVAGFHSEFRNGTQQDAHEFLSVVLQQLSSVSGEMKSAAAAETLSYTCPVEAHISFQMLNTRQCAGCGHESGRTEKYLNLSLVSKDSVSQGLLEYLKAEQLEFKCHCGASESWQRRSFSTLPK
uniref:USP domain-containing protein n=1 Tax=Tetraodon nigroviridis TaxID=99883 RepID=H3BY89_TETNG